MRPRCLREFKMIRRRETEERLDCGGSAAVEGRRENGRLFKENRGRGGRGGVKNNEQHDGVNKCRR
jgi:hypothetical protein